MSAAMKPGRAPWRLTEKGVPDVVDADGERICSMPMSAGEPASPANARLIAAAPELLEALEWAGAMLAVMRDRCIPGALDSYDRGLATVGAAIAKARRSP